MPGLRTPARVAVSLLRPYRGRVAVAAVALVVAALANSPAGGAGAMAAFGIASVMCVAILTAHEANGFFMNWSGSQAGEGFEYHLLAIGLSLVVLVSGGGKASLDSVIQRKLTANGARPSADKPL